MKDRDQWIIFENFRFCRKKGGAPRTISAGLPQSDRVRNLKLFLLRTVSILLAIPVPVNCQNSNELISKRQRTGSIIFNRVWLVPLSDLCSAFAWFYVILFSI